MLAAGKELLAETRTAICAELATALHTELNNRPATTSTTSTSSSTQVNDGDEKKKIDQQSGSEGASSLAEMEKRCKKMEETNERAKTRLKKMFVRYTEMKKQDAEREKKMKNLSAQLEAAKKANASLAETLDLKRRHLSETSQKLTLIESQERELLQKLKHLEWTHERANERSKKEMEEAKERMESLEAEKKELGDKLEEWKKSEEEKEEAWKKKLEETEERMGKQKDEIETTLKIEVDKHKAEIQVLQEKLALAEKRWNEHLQQQKIANEANAKRVKERKDKEKEENEDEDGADRSDWSLTGTPLMATPTPSGGGAHHGDDINSLTLSQMLNVESSEESQPFSEEMFLREEEEAEVEEGKRKKQKKRNEAVEEEEEEEEEGQREEHHSSPSITQLGPSTPVRPSQLIPTQPYHPPPSAMEPRHQHHDARGGDKED
ncbi:hypothetical protein QOT17_008786 [Balamuthia mandrillaris]